MSSCAVSAPGKVLVAGGYLVLDRAYTGLVFGLDARIHIAIKQSSTTHNGKSTVSVRSPQFSDPSWDYVCEVKEAEAGVVVTQYSSDSAALGRNPFVETTLRYVLAYISALDTSLQSLSIIILADNDYYTTGDAGIGRFHNFAIPLSNAHKTGLGSSAALVTALTAALLQFYLPGQSLSEDKYKRQLHNLAQLAHCAAQGKVGSGFDVASAVYGSCIYRRFSPALFSELREPGTDGFTTDLVQLVNETHNKQWDTGIQKNEVVVPKGLRMVMCDVSCGSQTPGMVRKVLDWRQSQPEAAEELWRKLHAANLGLAEALRNVATESSYFSVLTTAFNDIRRYIREMGMASDVAIEPPAQTMLIDACCKLPGVIGGTVPGAGGYDAIVLLIEDKEEVVAALQGLFKDWQFGADVGEGKVSMLGVREEMEGVRVESTRAYAQWV